MRKRNIKTLAHWVIMSVVLLFPVLMVMASNKAEDSKVVTINYKYETNEVESEEDLIVGNIYHFSYNSAYPNMFDNDEGCLVIDIYSLSILNFGDTLDFIYLDNVLSIDDDMSNTFTRIGFYYDNLSIDTPRTTSDYIFFIYADILISEDFEFDFIGVLKDFNNLFLDNNPNFTIEKCPMEFIPIESVEVEEMSLKDEINQWSAEFLDLPINAWYKQLTNAMNFPITSNSVMNVIYIYPLYVIWVYVFDLIADIFLVIVKLGHNLLEKVGGENE